MYNCEIYCVLNNNQSTPLLDQKIDYIAKTLYQKDIRVLYNTDVKSDPKAICNALFESEQTSDAPNYNIFINALDTADASSFKKLFYDFIIKSEQDIVPNEENKGKIAKIKISSLGEIANGYKGYCFRIFDKQYIVLPQAELCDMDVVDMINLAVDKAEQVFERNSVEHPDGIAFVEGKRKKQGFIKSFIPQKSDSKNQKVRKCIVLVAIFVIIFAAGYLLNELVIQPYLNEQITSEIHAIAYGNDNKDDPNKPAQDWDALKKINKEIVGWITIDGTKIDYPVLEHKGDTEHSQYYLNRTYKKDWSGFGSIFVDYRSTKSVKSKNVILHGHNIRDGSMFHSLVNYGDLKGNLNYYKKHPVIEFNTPEGDQKFKIISVFKTNVLYDHGYFFNYMQGSFHSDAEFMNFVYNCRVRSLINCPVMVNENDQLLTLSTCSYEFTNWRTVIVARKLREGENDKVNIELATLNSKPLFPEVYYSRYGGTRPEELTFKKANAKGLINWYDGSGKLEGSEVLSATLASNPTEATDESGKVISTKPKKVYQVKFLNYDGSEFYSANVLEGDSVKIPKGTPGLPKDAYYDYTFTGWNLDGLDIKNVQYNMTITPKFKATLKK